VSRTSTTSLKSTERENKARLKMARGKKAKEKKVREKKAREKMERQKQIRRGRKRRPKNERFDRRSKCQAHFDSLAFPFVSANTARVLVLVEGDNKSTCKQPQPL
jgi:hypothetical protein